MKIFNRIGGKIQNTDSRGRYGFKAKASAKEAEIWIYEEIGDDWYGGISAAQFVKDLKALGDLEKITLRINSPGGNVFDGIAIYNVLKQHKAKVVTYIDGYAASIASVVAMAGDEIYMAQNGIMMIHNAWALVVGNAENLRKNASELDKIDEAILSTYMTRVKKEKETICQMMADETWMSADECLEMGFIDSITDPMEMAACFDLQRFRYRNIPKPANQVAADQERKNRLARLDLACRSIEQKAASGRK
jgi:ATP-dependent Clp protease, protease subunit